MFTLRKLRSKALQYLFSYHVQKKTNALQVTAWIPSAQQITDHLLDHVAYIKHLSCSLLQLLIAWGELDLEKATVGVLQRKRTLRDNYLIQVLTLDPSCAQLFKEYPLLFPQEKIAYWYYEYLKQDHVFMSMVTERSTEWSDEVVVKKLMTKCLQASDIELAASQYYSYWQQDKLCIATLLSKSIKSLLTEQEQLADLYALEVPVQKVQFYTKLVGMVIASEVPYQAILSQIVTNWSIERINLLDQLLIQMAFAEIQHFPDIPIKVSLNEYLEIAKKYSTPNSARFINGVVDTVVKEGLLDPKDRVVFA